MKFPESWLRSVYDPALDTEALSHVLTMAGLEVEHTERVAPAFSGIVVGEVVSVEPHPNADRLRVCRVNVGSEVLQIVCGAPNVRAGMRVPCATVGAVLPEMRVKKAAMRGVESFGMLCSERELGIGDDHGGLMDLGAGATVGEDVRKALALDDTVFTLKLTPNRGDCLSIHGLAREVAALQGDTATLPSAAPIAPVHDERREIRLEAGDACPRYCGRIISGVDPKAPSPDWMVRRLQRCGVRPISALVDITNYAMLETGQPLHAFDLRNLQGGIRVRFARAGERLKLLDGRDIELSASHLVIADEVRPVALAGVMGGDASGVADDTSSVFLESAYFAPDAVAVASRGLDINSDAAHRFERGVDFALAPRVIERATELVLQICGGRPGPVVEALGRLPVRPSIEVRPERVRSLIGIDMDASGMAALLGRLGVAVEHVAGALRVTPPSFRFDLNIEEDYVEEVARVHGYDNIPPTLPGGRSPMLASQESLRPVEDLKRAFARRDYFEVVTFSFVDRQLEEDFAGDASAVALANPIASQMSVMRTTLLGSLVECARFNVARKQERVRVFESAACYGRGGDGFVQTERIAGLACGPALPDQWGDGGRAVDFYDVRGDIEAVLGARRLVFEPGAHPAFHPGQTARIVCDGRPAGWIGALHPRWVQKYELGASAVGFELDAAVIRSTELPAFRPVSRFPPVRRDIAVVVGNDVSATVIRAEILASGSPYITDATLFDVYRGRGVPEGRKSLAFRMLLQDTEKTFTDQEVEALVQNVVKNLKEKQGAMLRL